MKSWNLNSERKENGEYYSDDLIENLIERFETPDGSVRWDSPLITVTSDTTDFNSVFEAVDDALFKSKPAKQNKATIAVCFPPFHFNDCFFNFTIL